MLKINLIKAILLFLIVCCFSACGTDNTASTQSIRIDPTNLNQLQSLCYTPPRNTGSGCNTSAPLSQIRSKALQDTAMSLAAQGGLAWASRRINCKLEHDKWYLETIYNFNGMMLTHGIVPPVLVEGNNSLNLADPNTIRVADKTYLIVKQARFATTPPNWREYLWLTFNPPDIPQRFLLPQNREEQQVWRCAIDMGWEKGIEQASSIFQQNLAELKRDYRGMLLYRKLLEMRMISPPFVSRTELGVTGTGTDMRINDQVLRITELPTLQTDSACWKAIVVPNDNY